MARTQKAFTQKAYLTDYKERIEGLNPIESLKILRKLEADTMLSIKNGHTTTLYTLVEWNKDNQNDLKAIRRLIDLQYKRLEKVFEPYKNL